MRDGAPCGCDRATLAHELADTVACWAVGRGIPTPFRAGAEGLLDETLDRLFGFRFTECARCITGHGDDRHRCSDINHSCIAAAREFGRARYAENLEAHLGRDCPGDGECFGVHRVERVQKEDFF